MAITSKRWQLLGPIKRLKPVATTIQPCTKSIKPFLDQNRNFSTQKLYKLKKAYSDGHKKSPFFTCWSFANHTCKIQLFLHKKAGIGQREDVTTGAAKIASWLRSRLESFLLKLFSYKILTSKLPWEKSRYERSESWGGRGNKKLLLFLREKSVYSFIVGGFIVIYFLAGLMHKNALLRKKNQWQIYYHLLSRHLQHQLLLLRFAVAALLPD